MNSSLQAAYHEAGHLAVYFLIGRKVVTTGALLSRNDKSGITKGITINLPKSKKKLPRHIKMMALLAGLIAAKINQNNSENEKEIILNIDDLQTGRTDLENIERLYGQEIFKSDEFKNCNKATCDFLNRNWDFVSKVAEKLNKDKVIEHSYLSYILGVLHGKEKKPKIARCNK
jgi:hypothetical protein